VPFLSGGVLVAVVSHLLSAISESRDRKNDFRGFLGRWLGAVRQAEDGGISNTYSAHVEHLWGYYGKLRRDFCCKSKFRDLCNDLGSLKTKNIQNDAGSYREIIARKIGALIDFV
jgi:hypothetical protein